MSELLPGGNGTMKWIGRSGHSAAQTGVFAAAANNNSAANAGINRLIYPSGRI
jgi:hypothetical protein